MPLKIPIFSQGNCNFFPWEMGNSKPKFPKEFPIGNSHAGTTNSNANSDLLNKSLNYGSKKV